MADQQVVGKMGRVTGRIGPDRLGEVMISIRGGTESFHAYAADRADLIAIGRRRSWWSTTSRPAP